MPDEGRRRGNGWDATHVTVIIHRITDVLNDNLQGGEIAALDVGDNRNLVRVVGSAVIRWYAVRCQVDCTVHPV